MRRAIGWTFVLLFVVALGVAVLRPEPFQRLYYGVRHEEKIRSYSREFELDPHLVAALIYTESKFREGAVSEVGAVGLMQLMPETAREVAQSLGEEPPNQASLCEVDRNLRLGCKYLAQLQSRFPELDLALAAYNAGPSQVESWRREGRAIVFPETRAYVQKVKKTREKLRKLYPDW